MNPVADAPAVCLERVVKDYVPDWRGRKVRGLDGVSFTVARGSLCALVGANGSGKSTTLKLAAGLLRADAGRCAVLGESPAAAVRAGRVAYLPEETLLPQFDTAERFLGRLAQIGGVARAEQAEAVAAVLAQTGLRELAARPLASFSKGQRQRFGLAQALLRAPQVLLLDEPASGLDPRALAEMGELLREQRAAGRTVVLTSHFLTQVEGLCDCFIVLDRGRVLFDGDRDAVLAGGGLSRLYLEAAAR